MIISAYLGTAGLAGTGYSYYDSSETIIGSRVTTDIVDAGGGWYSTDTASIPTLAKSVRWDDTGDATALAREYFYQINQSIYNRTGVAQAGAAGTITLDSAASAVDDFYNNAIILLYGGTGVGQSRIISDYVGATKVATVNGNWATNPASGTEFLIIPFGAVPGATAPTAGENADAVWDEARAGHVGAGSFGEGVLVASGGITAASLASDTITAAKIAADAVTEIQAGLATPTNITAGTITTATNVTTVNGLAAGVITAASIAADAITAAKIANGAIDAATFAASAIDATAIASNAITAAKIATDAITSAQLAASAVTEIQTGLATPTNITAGTITTATNVTTVNGLAANVITAASIATDAIGSAELASSAADKIADQVWDEAIAGHVAAGSTGEKLNAAGSAGDPWSTAIPGAYGVGTAGYIVGNMVSSAWNTLLTSMTAAGSIGQKLANWVICRCSSANKVTGNWPGVIGTTMTPTFEQLPGGLHINGVAGNDLTMDVLIQDTNLTGYTFTAYIILEPSPLEKRQAMTVTNVDLAEGQIRVSLTDTETTAIGPVSGKPWFLTWDNGAGEQRNVLMGRFQLNRN